MCFYLVRWYYTLVISIKVLRSIKIHTAKWKCIFIQCLLKFLQKKYFHTFNFLNISSSDSADLHFSVSWSRNTTITQRVKLHVAVTRSVKPISFSLMAPTSSITLWTCKLCTVFDMLTIMRHQHITAHIRCITAGNLLQTELEHDVLINDILYRVS